jgi:hypothetical protein
MTLVAAFPFMLNPAVLVVSFVPPIALEATETYPVVVTDPDPIWISKLLVPLVDTPWNITVIRRTHDGMPVKSTDVPEAVTAVPLCRLSYTAPLFVVTPALPLMMTDIMLLLQV